MKRLLYVVSALLFATAMPARAEHPQADRASLRQAAYELEHATERLYERAVRRAQRGNHRAQEVLPVLYDLHERAERFHAKLDRNLRSPKRLRRQHERLRVAFRIAEDCAYDLRMRRLVRELDWIGGMVDSLDRQIEQVRLARYERRTPRNDPWPWLFASLFDLR